MPTNWKLFEQEYETILKEIEGFNPLLEDNITKEKNKAISKKLDELIDKWGIAPVMIYNSGIFKEHLQLDTQDKRVKYYNNWELMQGKFIATLNNKNLTNETVKIGDREFNYNSWLEYNKEDLKSFSDIQKETLFKTFLFMEQNVKYQVSYPFYTLIQQPNSSLTAQGDCNGMSALYAGMLERIYEENGVIKIATNASTSIKPIFTDIKGQVFEDHMRLKIGNTIIETTANQIQPLSKDDYLNKLCDLGKNKLIISAAFYDNEKIFTTDEHQTKAKNLSFETKFLKAKIYYFLRIESENTLSIDSHKTNLQQYLDVIEDKQKIEEENKRRQEGYKQREEGYKKQREEEGPFIGVEEFLSKFEFEKAEQIIRDLDKKYLSHDSGYNKSQQQEYLERKRRFYNRMCNEYADLSEQLFENEKKHESAMYYLNKGVLTGVFWYEKTKEYKDYLKDTALIEDTSIIELAAENRGGFCFTKIIPQIIDDLKLKKIFVFSENASNSSFSSEENKIIKYKDKNGNEKQIIFNKQIFDILATNCTIERELSLANPKKERYGTLFWLGSDEFISRGINITPDQMNVLESVFKEIVDNYIQEHKKIHPNQTPIQRLTDFLTKQVESYQAKYVEEKELELIKLKKVLDAFELTDDNRLHLRELAIYLKNADKLKANKEYKPSGADLQITNEDLKPGNIIKKLKDSGVIINENQENYLKSTLFDQKINFINVGLVK
jgi:hypothetical protein